MQQAKMFDYIKVWVNDAKLSSKLLLNENLEFITEFNQKTGEIVSERQTAIFHNLKFIVYLSGRVEISGSFHVYYNALKNIRGNFNDFTYSNFEAVLSNLHELFYLDFSKFRVSSLEYGVNVKTPFLIRDFLNSLITYKGKQFNLMSTKGPGDGRECFLSEHGIKIYNKGLQFGLGEILRFEKKTIKMRTITKEDLYLVDLLKRDIWTALQNNLLCSVEDLIIKDEFLVFDDLSIHDKLIILECSNPLSWKSFNIHQRAHKKKRYNKIVDKYGKKKYKGVLQTLLISSFRPLNV